MKTHPPRPVRRALVALAFLAALVVVQRLGRPTDDAVAEQDSVDVPFRMVESAAASGLVFRHRAPRIDARLEHIREHVAGLGAAVSVADVDGDGDPDIFLTTSETDAACGLFLNDGRGHFTEAASQAGLADLNPAGSGSVMGAVWGDYDNDGREDVYVYKWGRAILFHNEGEGRFRDVTRGSGLEGWHNTNGAVWFDYDRDGLLDLFIANYFRDEVNLEKLTSTRIMQDSFEYSRNGGRNRLFHNEGNGRFRDVTEETGVGSTRWTLAAAAADLDGDGWPDLYTANDYGPEEVYRNLEGKRFENMIWAGLEDDSKSGMCVAMGDVLGRGRLDVYVTNISERGYLFQGNNLRLNFLSEERRFREEARGAIADCGWAWGSQFGDLDNDGRVDLFVVNGFISGDRDRDYWYGMSKIAGGHGDVFEDALNWPAIRGASLSGYEQSRVFLNRGNRELVDVATQAGVVDIHDGRALAMVDVDSDGALDAVVANQGGPALLYRNTVRAGRHWILFSLRGTRSNRSAIGAQVTVTTGPHATMRIVDGGMGLASQNDRRLHFGLGKHTEAASVQVRWPSGEVETWRGLAGGRVHELVEGSAR